MSDGVSTAPAKAGRVLLLCPSSGLGGGVERYARGVQSALTGHGITIDRLDLRRPGEPAPSQLHKAAFVASARRRMRRAAAPTRLVVAHPYMAPVVPAVARSPHFAGATVICHGVDVWSKRRPRWRRILARDDVRVLAVSAFTAGALIQTANAVVAAPLLEQEWFDQLIAAQPAQRPDPTPVRVLTVLRLADWITKGVPVLLDALAVAREPVELVVAGSGSVPPGLAELVANCPWVTIESNLDDATLADRYATADIFVLATRTRTGPKPSGEGLGLSLVEAQLAGTVVIAPAHGGSRDAFYDGLTGLAPKDESAAALADRLRSLLSDAGRRTQMSRAAADWSRTAFDPARRSAALVDALL